MDRPNNDTNPAPPRDAHLQRALHHAPDHDLQAPPLLSASILAAARRAAEPTSGRRSGWFTWLAAPWAGAGTLAAVLLVSGVLWVQRDDLPPAVAPSEASADMGASTQRVEPTPAAEAAPPPPLPSPARVDQAAREARVGAAQPAAKPTPRPAAPAATKALHAEMARAAAPLPPSANGVPPAVAAAPVAAPPPAARAQEAVAAAPSPSPSPAAEAAPQRLRAWRPGLAGAAAGAAAAPASAAPAVPRPTAAVVTAAPSPVSPEAATAWSPVAADAVPRPLPAGWLERLAAATPSWEEAPAAYGPLAGARSITLWRQDEAVIWLQLARDRVQWCSAATGCRMAAIDAAEADALRAALPP